MVDSDDPVVVAVGVSHQLMEFDHLQPTMQCTASTAAALSAMFTGDGGCFSEDNAESSSDQGSDAYVVTTRVTHGQLLPRKCGTLP